MVYTIILILFTILCTFFYFIKHPKTKSPFPPGPNPYPIIGNIFQLGPKPHRYLADLAKTYGPLMSLRLGIVTAIIVSSAHVAKQMFENHDLALSSRKPPDAVRAAAHHRYSMAWLPVSPLWKNLRKISAIHLFSTSRLDATQSLRQAKVNELLQYVEECRRKAERVNMGQAGFTTSLNLLSNTFFSKNLVNYGSSKSEEFKELIWGVMEELGRPNLSDYFPFSKWVDPLGIRKRNSIYFHKLLGIFQEIIGPRLFHDDDDDRDVLGTLLSVCKERDSQLSIEDIKHLLLDLFVAGTDTTSSTLEWAMTELLRNPEKMKTAQIEIERVVGKDNPMQESDINTLPYLQAIVKETLRLHPPTVFLLPRNADTNVELYGHTVPQNAQILVNLWAIGRDPNAYEPDPDVFRPERFLGREIDLKGRDFELIPFGAGRRICPGLSLAYRMLNLMLGSLLHSFNWKLVDGMTKEDIDMTEKVGITLQKAKPLLADPLPK